MQIVSVIICYSLLLYSAASSVLLALHNCMYYGINRWAYFQEKSILCNNFIQKKGVGLFSSVGLFSGDCSNRPGQYTLLTVWENTKVLACTLYAISWIVVTFSRQSGMSPKGVWCSVWRMLLICWMLPLATHCHTHYHLRPFHFVLFKFKDLVAKQHLTKPDSVIPPVQ